MAWPRGHVNPTVLPSSATAADEALVVATHRTDLVAMRDAIVEGGNPQLRWMSQLGQRMCMGSAVVKGPPRRSGVDAATDAAQAAALELLEEHGYVMAPEQADQLLYGCMSSMSGPGVVRFLLRAGADIHERDFAGCTILHYVTRPDVVDVLVGAGASLDATDNGGMAPLHALAFRAGLPRYESLKPSVTDAVAPVAALLAAGAHVNARSHRGSTPLHCAVQGSDAAYVRAVVSTLLLHGADPTLESRDGATPLQLLLHPKYRRQAADAKRWLAVARLVSRAVAWVRRRHLLLGLRARDVGHARAE